jgi:hypothetical protein
MATALFAETFENQQPTRLIPESGGYAKGEELLAYFQFPTIKNIQVAVVRNIWI